MAHTIPVKYFYGGSVDALYCHPSYPIYSIGAGSAIGVFDACLVNGFGEVTLSSLTIDSQGIATATSNAHGYNKVPLVILISGADQEAINGEWEITGTTTNTILFNAVDSGLTNTTITGATIKLKVAPLGWEKVFVDVPNSVAVYRSKDPLCRRHFLRVDDSDSALSATPCTYFRGYEMMDSAQDSGLVPYPLASTLGRGVLTVKSIYQSPGIYITTNSANIAWSLIGTSRQFYFNPSYTNGNQSGFRMLMFFGDFVSSVPGDYGASMVIGGTSSAASNSPSGWESYNDYTGRYCARNLSRIIPTSSMRNKVLLPTGNSSSVMGASTTPPFLEPDVYCNRLIVTRPVIIVDESFPNNYRGEQPGMAVSMNRLGSLSPKYEANTILTAGGERFIYVPFEVWDRNFRQHSFIFR